MTSAGARAGSTRMPYRRSPVRVNVTSMRGQAKPDPPSSPVTSRAGSPGAGFESGTVDAARPETAEPRPRGARADQTVIQLGERLRQPFRELVRVARVNTSGGLILITLWSGPSVLSSTPP